MGSAGPVKPCPGSETQKMYRGKECAFIITGFGEEYRRCAEVLADILKTFDMDSIFGEGFGGGGIAEGVRAKLESSTFVIALMTRGTQVAENVWEPRTWLREELAWSDARGKDALILVEDGVSLSGGILGDVETLRFNADRFTEVLPAFIRNLKSLLNRRYLTLGIMDLPIFTHIQDEHIVDECNDEAKFLILKMRQLAKQQRYSEALQYARRATEVDPRAWRAWTSYGALLVQLGEVDQGDAIFARVLNEFQKNRKAKAAAIHNRAWVKAIKAGYAPSTKSLVKQAKMYARALSLDTSRVYSRASLLIVLLQLGNYARANRLLEESVMFEDFLEALRFELDIHGAELHGILQALPTWVRFMLYPKRRTGSGGYEY
jgi:hypothetical protein